MSKIYNFYHNTLSGNTYTMMCIISSIIIIFCIIYFIVSLKRRIEKKQHNINIDFSKLENGTLANEDITIPQSKQVEIQTTIVKEEEKEKEVDFLEFNKNPLDNIKDSKNNEGFDSAITSKEVLDSIVTTEVDEGGSEKL